MSEKILSPGLPHIPARKSWDFLILTVSASTVEPEAYPVFIKGNVHTFIGDNSDNFFFFCFPSEKGSMLLE